VCEDGTCIVILICVHTHGDGKSKKKKKAYGYTSNLYPLFVIHECSHFIHTNLGNGDHAINFLFGVALGWLILARETWRG
jgi:hypothetical protein